MESSDQGAGRRTFSKTIAVTYMGLGFFALLFLSAAVIDAYQGAVSRSPLLLALSVVTSALAFGFVYMIFALRRRRNWARRAAIAFWLLCLIWSVSAIVRNGPHPPAPSGPFEYSNEFQVEGARFSALAMPYFMALVESAAIYCLWRKASLVNQFKVPEQA